LRYRAAIEQGVLDLTVVEPLEALPQPSSSNYEIARFNALRHGVLSQFNLGCDSLDLI